MNNLKIGFALLLLLVILTVIIQNTSIVPLHFLGWKMELSLVVVITTALLIGFGIGLLTAAIVNVRRKRQTTRRAGSAFGA